MSDYLQLARQKLKMVEDYHLQEILLFRQCCAMTAALNKLYEFLTILDVSSYTSKLDFDNIAEQYRFNSEKLELLEKESAKFYLASDMVTNRRTRSITNSGLEVMLLGVKELLSKIAVLFSKKVTHLCVKFNSYPNYLDQLPKDLQPSLSEGSLEKAYDLNSSIQVGQSSDSLKSINKGEVKNTLKQCSQSGENDKSFIKAVVENSVSTCDKTGVENNLGKKICSGNNLQPEKAKKTSLKTSSPHLVGNGRPSSSKPLLNNSPLVGNGRPSSSKPLLNNSQKKIVNDKVLNSRQKSVKFDTLLDKIPLSQSSSNVLKTDDKAESSVRNRKVSTKNDNADNKSTKAACNKRSLSPKRTQEVKKTCSTRMDRNRRKNNQINENPQV